MQSINTGHAISTLSGSSGFTTAVQQQHTLTSKGKTGASAGAKDRNSDGKGTDHTTLLLWRQRWP
jgi:surface antigen